MEATLLSFGVRTTVSIQILTYAHHILRLFYITSKCGNPLLTCDHCRCLKLVVAVSCWLGVWWEDIVKCEWLRAARKKGSGWCYTAQDSRSWCLFGRLNPFQLFHCFLLCNPPTLNTSTHFLSNPFLSTLPIIQLPLPNIRPIPANHSSMLDTHTRKTNVSSWWVRRPRGWDFPFVLTAKFSTILLRAVPISRFHLQTNVPSNYAKKYWETFQNVEQHLDKLIDLIENVADIRLLGS